MIYLLDKFLLGK